jgi:hypothetical protein
MVRIARAECKRKRKDLNILTSQLQKERTEVVNKALLEFKKKRRADYLDALTRYRLAFEGVRREEQAEYDAVRGPNSFASQGWYSLYMQDSAIDTVRIQQDIGLGVSSRRNDPSQLGFWSF